MESFFDAAAKGRIRDDEIESQPIGMESLLLNIEFYIFKKSLFF